MDRIRAGLTGLAAVFLVTAAASLLFAPDEAEKTAAAQQEPGEPLAQLGVAPGSDKGPTPRGRRRMPSPSPGCRLWKRSHPAARPTRRNPSIPPIPAPSARVALPDRTIRSRSDP
jgi:hypothetical protein